MVLNHLVHLFISWSLDVSWVQEVNNRAVQVLLEKESNACVFISRTLQQDEWLLQWKHKAKKEKRKSRATQWVWLCLRYFALPYQCCPFFFFFEYRSNFSDPTRPSAPTWQTHLHVNFRQEKQLKGNSPTIVSHRRLHDSSSPFPPIQFIWRRLEHYYRMIELIKKGNVIWMSC